MDGNYDNTRHLGFKNITEGDYYKFKHGAVFIPARTDKSSASSLLFGSDSYPYPCSVPIKDLKIIEKKPHSLFYTPVNSTTEARKTYAGGLKVTNTNLATFRMKICSGFSREEFREIRKVFTIGI